MIKIFTIQPEVLAEPNFFREYFKDFGPDKGRWIGLFPSDWKRRVVNLIQGTPACVLPPGKKRELREKIQNPHFRDRFVRIPETFIVATGPDWLHDAESLVATTITEGVMAAGNPRANEKVLVAGEFDPDCDTYQAVTNQRVAKTPRALFQAVRSVVRVAREIDIVDPYVQSIGPAAISFAELLDLIFRDLRASGSICKKVAVHLKKPDLFRPAVQQRNFETLLSPILDGEEIVTVSFWELNDEADRNHDRHLITDAAAIMSSYGWAKEGGGNPTTDISPKKAETHRKLSACFCRQATNEFGRLTGDATITITSRPRE
jgi:hypothetical protein